MGPMRWIAFITRLVMACWSHVRRHGSLGQMHVLTKVDDVHLCEEQCEEQQRHFVAKGA